MISSRSAKHPNCMYMWMNWIISPKVNAEVAEYFGEAPAQSKPYVPAKAQTGEPELLRPNTTRKTRRSGSASTTGRRRSPTAATAKTDCKDYNDWVQAWTAIKG